MPKVSVAALRHECPYTSLPEYSRTTLGKPRLREELRRKYGGNWYVGKTAAEKRAMFAKAKADLTKRYEAEFSNHKTLDQIKNIAAAQNASDCEAGSNNPTCAICRVNSVQVAWGCTHMYCLACTANSEMRTCPVCRKPPGKTYTLVSDNTVI